MKHTAKLFTLLAAVLCLTACEKNKEELRHERDIVYTVAEETTTVHLTTEAEWQQLLDRFCDYAEEGSSVTFRNAQSANKSATKEAVTYSTTSREEMKRWMAQMEDEGKTVTVTHDPATGTWNGTAYATAPQPPQHEDCYTGVVVSVGNPPLDSIVPPGIVAALRISHDSTMIIAMNGQWFWNGLILDGVTYSDGDTITLCGTVQNMQDYYGNGVLVLELGETISPDQPPVPSGGLITYEHDGMNIFGYIWSFDTVNHLVYITLHYTLQNITQPDYPVGVYEYRHADEVNTPFAYWLIDQWGDTAGLYILNSIGNDTLHYNTNPLGYPATLVRTDRWHTYICSNWGLNIVMHVGGNVIEVYPEVYVGQMGVNGLERLDVIWPFGAGRFEMWRTEMTQPAMGPTYWGLTLDFRPFGGTDTLGGFFIQGIPLVDNQFTITKEGGSQFLFQKL